MSRGRQNVTKRHIGGAGSKKWEKSVTYYLNGPYGQNIKDKNNN
jgi:hypothetical protein